VTQLATPTDFWIVMTRSGNYMITEETALSVASAYRKGVTLIEFDCLDGGRMLIPRERIENLSESTSAIREFTWRHNAAMSAEKKAAGFFEDGE